jgi:hypothetical protein
MIMMMKITWRRRIPCEEDKEEEKQDNKDDGHTTIHTSITSKNM